MSSERARQRLSVAMPILNLVPGEMGGSETYVRHLLAGLANRDDVVATVILSPAAAGHGAGNPEVVERRVRGGASTTQRLMSLVGALLASAESREVVRQADVVHFPLSVVARRPGRSGRFVQTLHDVQHRDLAEAFSRAEKLYRAVFYDRPARQADAVITVSNFCRDRIAQTLDVPTEKVWVVPHGVDVDDFPFFSGPRDEFVLYPARSWHHKNHRRLFEAMERVRERRPSLRLVLTGDDDLAWGKQPAWAERRGLVPRQELAELYRRAACLAFPSLYEGFGLPILEAMASGCPVASSSAGALPEVCGDAAVLFDPLDVAGMAAAIERAMDGRDRLVPRGLLNVQRFTWERCVDRHVEVYRAVAGTGERRA